MRLLNLLLAAIGISLIVMMAAGLPAHAASAATVSPKDRAACTAAYHFHHVMVTPRLYSSPPVFWNADEQALAAAYAASPAVAGVIVHYVDEGDGWSWVRSECQPYV